MLSEECLSGEVVCCQKSESTVPRIKDYFCLYRCYTLILVSLCRQGNCNRISFLVGKIDNSYRRKGCLYRSLENELANYVSSEV